MVKSSLWTSFVFKANRKRVYPAQNRRWSTKAFCNAIWAQSSAQKNVKTPKRHGKTPSWTTFSIPGWVNSNKNCFRSQCIHTYVMYSYICVYLLARPHVLFQLSHFTKVSQNADHPIGRRYAQYVPAMKEVYVCVCVCVRACVYIHMIRRNADHPIGGRYAQYMPALILSICQPWKRYVCVCLCVCVCVCVYIYIYTYTHIFYIYTYRHT